MPHDQGMMATMEALLEGMPGDVEQKTWAQRLATMPMRMGGLGLRSATRMSPAAYWASWADALHMISQRLPEVANDIVTQLQGEPAGFLAELQGAANELDRCGLWGDPVGKRLKAGARQPAPEVTKPGEWAPRLATSCVFFFRVPLPGDHGVVSVVACRPGPPSVAFRSRRGFLVPRVPNSAGVPSATCAVSNIASRKDEVATTDHRSTVRLRFSVG